MHWRTMYKSKFRGAVVLVDTQHGKLWLNFTKDNKRALPMAKGVRHALYKVQGALPCARGAAGTQGI